MDSEKRANRPPEDWRPEPVRSFLAINPVAGETIKVAEILAPFGEHSTLEIFSGLVAIEQVREMLSKPWEYSWPMQSSGPHLTTVDEDPIAKPWFSLGNHNFQAESLIVSWESGSK